MRVQRPNIPRRSFFGPDLITRRGYNQTPFSDRLHHLQPIPMTTLTRKRGRQVRLSDPIKEADGMELAQGTSHWQECRMDDVREEPPAKRVCRDSPPRHDNESAPGSDRAGQDGTASISPSPFASTCDSGPQQMTQRGTHCVVPSQVAAEGVARGASPECMSPMRRPRAASESGSTFTTPEAPSRQSTTTPPSFSSTPNTPCQPRILQEAMAAPGSEDDAFLGRVRQEIDRSERSNALTKSRCAAKRPPVVDGYAVIPAEIYNAFLMDRKVHQIRSWELLHTIAQLQEQLKGWMSRAGGSNLD